MVLQLAHEKGSERGFNPRLDRRPICGGRGALECHAQDGAIGNGSQKLTRRQESTARSACVRSVSSIVTVLVVIEVERYSEGMTVAANVASNIGCKVTQRAASTPARGGYRRIFDVEGPANAPRASDEIGVRRRWTLSRDHAEGIGRGPAAPS